MRVYDGILEGGQRLRREIDFKHQQGCRSRKGLPIATKNIYGKLLFLLLDATADADNGMVDV